MNPYPLYTPSPPYAPNAGLLGPSVLSGRARLCTLLPAQAHLARATGIIATSRRTSVLFLVKYVFPASKSGIISQSLLRASFPFVVGDLAISAPISGVSLSSFRV